MEDTSSRNRCPPCTHTLAEKICRGTARGDLAAELTLHQVPAGWRRSASAGVGTGGVDTQHSGVEDRRSGRRHAAAAQSGTGSMAAGSLTGRPAEKMAKMVGICTDVDICSEGACLRDVSNGGMEGADL